MRVCLFCVVDLAASGRRRKDTILVVVWGNSDFFVTCLEVKIYGHEEKLFTLPVFPSIFLWGIYFSTTRRGKKKQIIRCTVEMLNCAPKKNGRLTPSGCREKNSPKLQPPLTFQVYSMMR